MIHLRYLLLMIALCLASDADAQCGGGRCPAPAAPIMVPDQATPVFMPAVASPVCREDGLAEQVRVLAKRIDRLGDQLRSAKRATPCVDSCGCGRCPERCPCRETASRCGDGCRCVVGEKLPTGVVSEKLSETPRYSLDGKEISRKEAHRLIEAGDDRIPDDAGKVRVIVVGGTDAQRRQVLEDLGKAPAAISDKFIPHAYPADSPMVKDRGYVASGSPSITLTAGNGKVIARNLDGTYRGPEALYAAIEAAAKYDPSKDRDLWGGQLSWESIKKWLSAEAGKVPPAAWGLGLAGAALLVLTGNKRKKE